MLLLTSSPDASSPMRPPLPLHSSSSSSSSQQCSPCADPLDRMMDTLDHTAVSSAAPHTQQPWPSSSQPPLSTTLNYAAERRHLPVHATHPRHDNLDSSPSNSPLQCRLKRRLFDLAHQADDFMASLALQTPVKPDACTSTTAPSCSRRVAGPARAPLSRSMTLPAFTNRSAAVPSLPTTTAGHCSWGQPPAKQQRMSGGDDNDNQDMSVSLPVSSSCLIPANTKTQTVTSPHHSLSQSMPSPCAYTNVHSGERLSIPHSTSDRDALKRISNETLVKLLRGEYAHLVDTVDVIDCRFAYEYDGGHIRDAVNVNTQEDLLGRYFPHSDSSAAAADTDHVPSTPPTRRVLVFHCEFSAARGPKLALYLRKEDRLVNAARYPQLNFPEVYVLEGGYKDFYNSYQSMCSPVGYVEMKSVAHKQELKTEKLRRGGSYIRQDTASTAAGSLESMRSRVSSKSFCVVQRSLSPLRCPMPSFTVAAHGDNNGNENTDKSVNSASKDNQALRQMLLGSRRVGVLNKPAMDLPNSGGGGVQSWSRRRF